MRTVLISLFLALHAAVPRAHADSSWAGAYSVELVDEHGRVLPTYTHHGRAYVLGVKGERYLVRVHNRSPRRTEVVVSVDGRDVIDGRTSGVSKRGYVIEPYGELTVDGFRTSDSSVAAFRFSSVSRSYAARTGDARDVGVIGVAVFPERQPPAHVYIEPPFVPYWPPPHADLARPERSAPGSAGESIGRGQDAGKSAAPAAEAPAGRAAEGKKAEGAPSPAPLADAQRSGRVERPGLGTEFGEHRYSSVYRTHFERESAQPAAVLTLRYNDRAGLRALGIPVEPATWVDERYLRETAEPFRRDRAYATPPPGWRP